jgi:hypothetical protein
LWSLFIVFASNLPLFAESCSALRQTPKTPRFLDWLLLSLLFQIPASSRFKIEAAGSDLIA